jgi:hypothetical protein
MTHSTYEVSQPWVAYHYGATHDGWWPLWRSTHVIGRAIIRMECAVCGKRETARLRIPRFGPIPDRGPHPVRQQFLVDHAHPDRPHPMAWAKPLLNPAAHPGGLNLDMLGMRLSADISAAHDAPTGREGPSRDRR